MREDKDQVHQTREEGLVKKEPTAPASFQEKVAAKGTEDASPRESMVDKKEHGESGVFATPEMTKCSFCFGEVPKEAVKCRHCGSDFRGTAIQQAQEKVRKALKSTIEKAGEVLENSMSWLGKVRNLWTILWVRWLFLAVILGAIGFAGYTWYQGYKKKWDAHVKGLKVVLPKAQATGHLLSEMLQGWFDLRVCRIHAVKVYQNPDSWCKDAQKAWWRTSVTATASALDTVFRCRAINDRKVKIYCSELSRSARQVLREHTRRKTFPFDYKEETLSRYKAALGKIRKRITELNAKYKVEPKRTTSHNPSKRIPDKPKVRTKVHKPPKARPQARAHPRVQARPNPRPRSSQVRQAPKPVRKKPVKCERVKFRRYPDRVTRYRSFKAGQVRCFVLGISRFQVAYIYTSKPTRTRVVGPIQAAGELA